MSNLTLTLNPINGFSLVNESYHEKTYNDNTVIAEGILNIKDGVVKLGNRVLGTIKNNRVNLNPEMIIPSAGYVIGLCNQILYLNSVSKLH